MSVCQIHVGATLVVAQVGHHALGAHKGRPYHRLSTRAVQ